MDIELRDRFIFLWQNYFYGTELPITFEFRKDTVMVQNATVPDRWRCIICQIGRVRNGASLALDAQSITCRGGLLYSGYQMERPPDFRYFLSYGKPGGVEGERYKQTPELVDTWQSNIASISSKGKNIVFTRWDHLAAGDNPEVVIFFARPEVLSGLFTLANFDQSDPNGVICPMGAGCRVQFHHTLSVAGTTEGRSKGSAGHVRSICPALHAPRYAYYSFSHEEIYPRNRVHGEEFLNHKNMGYGTKEDRTKRLTL
jgi:hypothetical protein